MPKQNLCLVGMLRGVGFQGALRGKERKREEREEKKESLEGGGFIYLCGTAKLGDVAEV